MIHTSNRKRYETDAYNSGWLAGYDALVLDLYEGFNQNLPTWLKSLIGGKKAIAGALKRQQSIESMEVDGDEIIFEPDYEDGEMDGYEELLEEIVEAFKQKHIEMPAFLQQIVGAY